MHRGQGARTSAIPAASASARFRTFRARVSAVLVMCPAEAPQQFQSGTSFSVKPSAPREASSEAPYSSPVAWAFNAQPG